MNQSVKSGHSIKWKKNYLNKTRRRQMRADTKIYWKPFESLLADTAQYYYKCGQQTKCFTSVKKWGCG